MVSAKGPSFSTSNCELNGHSCTIAQALDTTGKASYFIGEGTTNLQSCDLPKECSPNVSIVLSTGSKTFNTREALGIIGENMGELLTTKGKTRVGQCIPLTFNGKDPYTSCPFYMASFYLGLQMGSTTPGVIPLDARQRPKASLAESKEGETREGLSLDPCQPLFGAPVAGLSEESVRAMPINLGRVLGEEAATAFLKQVEGRNLESYPPRADEKVLVNLASRWGDLEALAGLGAKDPLKWVISCAESCECADMNRALYEYKRRLGNEFNALQAKDPLTDGVRMTVKQHMLAVVCHFHVPLPTNEKWDLSCARNLRQAIKAVPFCEAGARVASQFSLL